MQNQNRYRIENTLHSNIYSYHACCVIGYHPYTDTLAQINYVYEQSARRNKTPKSVGIWRVKQ